MRTLSTPLILLAALVTPVLAADNDPAADAIQAPAAANAMALEGPRAIPGVTPPAGFPSFDRVGPSVVFAAVADGAGATQVFRFANGGRAAGTVTATLYDAAAGPSLGTWTSASIPAGAAIEVTAATVVSGLTATQRANPINIAVSSKLQGTAQLLTKTASARQSERLRRGR